MKKSWFLEIITAMCLLCLTGCGEKFHVEETQLFDKESLFEGENLSDWRLVGSQYEQGEPVQFWAHMPIRDEDGNFLVLGDLYKYSADGNRELIRKDVYYESLMRGRWWYDNQGRCLMLTGDTIEESLEREYDATDKSIQDVLEQLPKHLYIYETVKDICQFPDGKIMVIMKKGGVSDRVAELNWDLGKLEIAENVVMRENDYDAIGVGEKGILLVSDEGIREVDLETGEEEMLVPFTDTDYVWNKELWADFRLCEDGTVEILWEDGKREKVWYGKIQKDGTPIIAETGEAAETEEEKNGNKDSEKENDKQNNGLSYAENGENGEYYDIQSEETQLFEKERFFAGKEADDWKLIGSQYEQGKPIQLWAEKPLWDENNNIAVAGDIYLYREDGSREVVLQNIPYENTTDASRWWRDRQGNFFVLEWNGIRGLDGKGNEIFYKQTGENVRDICQLADGRIIVLLREMGNLKLAELDPDTGILKMSENISLGVFDYETIGAGRKGILLVNGEGIRETDWETGTTEVLIPFMGTTYIWDQLFNGDFLLEEDGTVGLLWQDGRQECLRYEKLNGNRTQIVMRCTRLDEWTKKQIIAFNKSNTKYHVVLEESAAIGSELQDFKERTDMKIAMGQGADIICSGAVNDAYSLLSKGAFEDLESYMEQSGIKTEDYFPLLSGWIWENKIYGVNIMANVLGVKIDERFVPRGEEITPDSLLDRMLQYTGKEVFVEGWDAVDVLNYFLCGSEDLWGMIDWGNYTAGFHDKLFYKMLEAAKRYGDTETNGYPAIADYRYYFTFYSYENKEKLEEEGMVSVGYLFDDGCYEQVIPQSLAINKNSGCKEGAWELIAFLLGEKAQETLSVKKSELYFPVNKKVYEVLKEDAVKNGKEEDGSVVSIWGEITTADAEELTAEIEDARVLPIRTKPILDIVYEEAQEYFAGVKTAEDVAEVIENRVQLFLDETKN